jgi:ribose transport system permease protein
MPIGWVILLALVSGLAVGLVNAFFIVFFRIPSLVVTLGTTSLITGIVQWMTNSSTIGGIDERLIDAVVGGRLVGVPYAFYYALLTAIVTWYVFDYTPLGRRLLFVGRGREVARLNGIAVDRVRVGALAVSGIVASAAGIVYAGVLGSADPYSGRTTCYRPSRQPSLAPPPSCQGASMPGAPSSPSIFSRRASRD